MKRSRFAEEQIIRILKEYEAGVSAADLCRKHGVSDASIYKWKAKFRGIDVSEPSVALGCWWADYSGSRTFQARMEDTVRVRSRRDLALGYAKVSAPAPIAPPPNTAIQTPGANSPLDKTWGQCEG